jgi:glycosyltransferase involved in cell wall biosynthesis
VPLRSWTYIGLSIATLAFVYGGFVIGRTLWSGNPVPGYASTISVMLFMGGIELIGIGVIGEYVGRIYYESKERPVYLVRRRYQAKSKVSMLPGVRQDARAHVGRVELTRKRAAPRFRVVGH